MQRPDPYVGTELLSGQFRVIERIGSGGMGAVYRAQQPSMDRFVAVKILHSKFTNRKDLVSRFRREARAMSHLTHPNTAKVYLYGQLDDGSCYIVMEYLEGKNLGQVVRHEGPMEPTRAIGVLLQACAALGEAHEKGIVHRDLKPENIFLANSGGIRDYVKVLDFGLAKVTEREMRPGSMILTQEGMVFGTPEFMSPEQAQGKTLDARSDIYSLGVILYELVTGKLPFEAPSPMEFVTLHVTATPIPLAQRAPDKVFPVGLQQVLDRAMAKHPDQRYQSATELAIGLKGVLPAAGLEELLNRLPSGTFPTGFTDATLSGGAVTVTASIAVGQTTDELNAIDDEAAARAEGLRASGVGAGERASVAKQGGKRPNVVLLLVVGVVIGAVLAVAALKLIG